jgi:hypothetical protein
MALPLGGIVWELPLEVQIGRQAPAINQGDLALALESSRKTQGCAKRKVPPFGGTFPCSMESELAAALALLVGVLAAALTARVLLLLAGLLAAALLLAGFLTRVLVLLARILVRVGHRDLPLLKRNVRVERDGRRQPENPRLVSGRSGSIAVIEWWTEIGQPEPGV